MGIGVSLLLLAVGAILAFAVHASVNGIDLQAVGVILMVVGGIGILLDLLILAPRRRRYTHTQVQAPDPVPTARNRSWTRDEVDGTY